jgi:hypothetical protein
MRGLIFLLGVLPLSVMAMPIKSQMLKPRAYFIEADNNLLEALDLKAKTMTFGKADFDQCGASLVRKAQTLIYSCTLPIPSKAKVTRLQNLVTANKITIPFGATKREVMTQISPDAKTLTLTTSFDSTAIDYEISKFNDDFFAVYAKVAQLVISDALSKQPIRIEVLESR